MSDLIRCDGCNTVMPPNAGDHAIHGEPIGAAPLPEPLPRRAFDLCIGCAVIAFDAIARAR